jgi:hypothetical protein
MEDRESRIAREVTPWDPLESNYGQPGVGKGGQKTSGPTSIGL